MRPGGTRRDGLREPDPGLGTDGGASVGIVPLVWLATCLLALLTSGLVGDFTALALVFAAKGIIRARDDEHASSYLLGTLLNFTWGLVLALLARLALETLP